MVTDPTKDAGLLVDALIEFYFLDTRGCLPTPQESEDLIKSVLLQKVKTQGKQQQTLFESHKLLNHLYEARAYATGQKETVSPGSASPDSGGDSSDLVHSAVASSKSSKKQTTKSVRI